MSQTYNVREAAIRKVVRAGLALREHADHDQSSHGNWASGSRDGGGARAAKAVEPVGGRVPKGRKQFQDSEKNIAILKYRGGNYAVVKKLPNGKFQVQAKQLSREEAVEVSKKLLAGREPGKPAPKPTPKPTPTPTPKDTETQKPTAPDGKRYNPVPEENWGKYGERQVAPMSAKEAAAEIRALLGDRALKESDLRGLDGVTRAEVVSGLKMGVADWPETMRGMVTSVQAIDPVFSKTAPDIMRGKRAAGTMAAFDLVRGTLYLNAPLMKTMAGREAASDPSYSLGHLVKPRSGIMMNEAIVVHEMGHALDSAAMQMWKKVPAFTGGGNAQRLNRNGIAAATKKNPISLYGGTNEFEAFAEHFVAAKIGTNGYQESPAVRKMAAYEALIKRQYANPDKDFAEEMNSWDWRK